MAAGKPGPARKPHLQAVREGEKRAKSRPDPILLPPEAPPEPDWVYLQPVAKDSIFPASSAPRIRKRARYLWRRWVSILDPQGVLAVLDEVTVEDVALCAARLEEVGRLIWTTTDHSILFRLLAEEGRLRKAYQWYVPHLGLSPAARLEAREGGRPDDDFDV